MIYGQIWSIILSHYINWNDNSMVEIIRLRTSLDTDRRRTRATYLYPYSMLSPQPPQTQSLLRSFGLPDLEQLHVFRRPSLQARAMACVTPAALIAWTNAASRLPVTDTQVNDQKLKKPPSKSPLGRVRRARAAIRSVPRKLIDLATTALHTRGKYARTRTYIYTHFTAVCMFKEPLPQKDFLPLSVSRRYRKPRTSGVLERYTYSLI